MVVWRRLRGFGASLPVAWSHPTFVRYEASYPLLAASYPCSFDLLSWRSGHPRTNFISVAYHLYPHRFSGHSLSFIYLTEAVLICNNSQAYLPCIYCLIETGSEERNVILLDQRLWKLKTYQLLLVYCLLEGPWAIIFFFLFSSSFFQVDTEVPLILLPDTCLFFLRGCRALAPFYFLEIFIFLHSPCL